MAERKSSIRQGYDSAADEKRLRDLAARQEAEHRRLIEEEDRRNRQSGGMIGQALRGTYTRSLDKNKE